MPGVTTVPSVQCICFCTHPLSQRWGARPAPAHGRAVCGRGPLPGHHASDPHRITCQRKGPSIPVDHIGAELQRQGGPQAHRLHASRRPLPSSSEEMRRARFKESGPDLPKSDEAKSSGHRSSDSNSGVLLMHPGRARGRTPARTAVRASRAAALGMICVRLRALARLEGTTGKECSEEAATSTWEDAGRGPATAEQMGRSCRAGGRS